MWGWICPDNRGQRPPAKTADNLGEVLTITAQRPSEAVKRRLGQLANALERPRFQTASLALDLRDQIRTAAADLGRG